jgi:predicted RND superfamily exporter protein
MAVTLNDIKLKLEGIEDVIVHGVQHVVKLPLWVKIVAGVVIILFIILIITLFKKRDPVNTDYLQKMDQLDSTVKYQQKYIESLQDQQAMRDTIIMRELGRISGNKQTQTRIIHEYSEIPNRVHSLSNDDLRKQITEY